jgi:hypothetical protein
LSDARGCVGDATKTHPTLIGGWSDRTI